MHAGLSSDGFVSHRIPFHVTVFTQLDEMLVTPSSCHIHLL